MQRPERPQERIPIGSTEVPELPRLLEGGGSLPELRAKRDELRARFTAETQTRANEAPRSLKTPYSSSFLSYVRSRPARCTTSWPRSVRRARSCDTRWAGASS